MLNSVVMMGRLTADPELRTTPNGVSVTTFTIAVDRPFQKSGADRVADFDAVAFGCPAMGAEELEENEFDPMFQECRPKLAGKKIGLFGSYGWGDGEWMRSWEETCRSDGADLVSEGVTCLETPDDDALNACRELGASLA